MTRLRRRWRYIGWAAVAVAAFLVALVLLELFNRM